MKTKDLWDPHLGGAGMFVLTIVPFLYASVTPTFPNLLQLIFQFANIFTQEIPLLLSLGSRDGLSQATRLSFSGP